MIYVVETATVLTEWWSCWCC